MYFVNLSAAQSILEIYQKRSKHNNIYNNASNQITDTTWLNNIQHYLKLFDIESSCLDNVSSSFVTDLYESSTIILSLLLYFGYQLHINHLILHLIVAISLSLITYYQILLVNLSFFQICECIDNIFKNVCINKKYLMQTYLFHSKYRAFFAKCMHFKFPNDHWK